MPKYKNFEDLQVWLEAAKLYNRVLDLLEQTNLPVSSGFRNQLDRAALSISNNIAEGFERATTGELVTFLAIARGSSGEVRSMVAVVQNRPKLKPHLNQLLEIRSLAQSCTRQLTGWTVSVENSEVQGKRHLTERMKESQRAAKAAQDFRTNFLKHLKIDHPLYHSTEARVARGELEV